MEKGTHHSPPPTKLARLSCWRAPSPFLGLGVVSSFEQVSVSCVANHKKKNIMPCNTVGPVALVRHDVPISWLLMLKHHGCSAASAFVSATLVMPGNLPTKKNTTKIREEILPMHSGCIKPCNLSNNLDLTGSDLFPSTVPHEKWQSDLGLPRGILLVVEDFWARKRGEEYLCTRNNVMENWMFMCCNVKVCYIHVPSFVICITCFFWKLWMLFK